MADVQFAGYSAGVVLGLIIFLLLLGRLGKAGQEAAVDLALPDPVTAAVSPAVSAPAPAAPPPVKKEEPAAPAPADKRADQAEKADKTVVLPPAAAATPDHPPVDLHMYEALARRIGGLEGEFKREPLFLDPLLKRVAHLEKHLEALAEQVTAAPAAAPAAPAANPTAPAEFTEEFIALKEKVYGLQKILEHLAEGSAPPTAP